MVSFSEQRILTGKEDIICFKLWDVEKSDIYPTGKKFSFVFIHNNKRILGYDNCEGKGFHKHYIDFDKNEEIEISLDETGIEKIYILFKKEIGEITRKLYKK